MMATFALSDKGLARATELNPAFSKKTNQQLVKMTTDARKAEIAIVYSKALQRLRDSREP